MGMRCNMIWQKNWIEISPLNTADCASAMTLWQGCDGICLRQESDSEQTFRRFITRNPGLCLGAWEGDHLIGSVLAGHDSQRAYLYHLAVAETYRRQGVASKLVQAVLNELRRIEITKAHLFVEADNDAGLTFWQAIGAERRNDLTIFSLNTGASR